MKKNNLIKASLVVAFLFATSIFGFSSAFGYGGGGGEVVGLLAAPCSSVVFGEWGACVNGFQYRDVASQSPFSCSLSTGQQLERSRSCATSLNPTIETANNTLTNLIKQVLGEKKYADGTLVRYKGDPRIYIIVNGEKQHIRTLAELRKYAGKNILTISSEDGEKTYTDGSLLRGTNKKIYILSNGKLIHIRTLTELKKHAGKKINDVSDSVINEYQK